MSELAFNANGEHFEIPATVTAWRVRRMKDRGAPVLVYGSDGRPLTIPSESDIDDLRDATGIAGKYRLDPINDDGKPVENVPVAYVQVDRAERVESTAIVAASHPSNDMLREAMLLNTSLAKSVIDKFPDMMTAAAELLRAADGAGLPARLPRVVEPEDDDEEDDEVGELAPGASAFGFDLNALVATIVPVLMKSLLSGNMKLPGLAALFDWRKASPKNDPSPTTAHTGSATPTDSTPHAAHTPKAKPTASHSQARTTTHAHAATEEVPPLDPAAMGHVLAIQSQLQPQEVAFVQEVAKEMSAAELRAWFDKLAALSVPEAVDVIRGLIAGKHETGGAS